MMQQVITVCRHVRVWRFLCIPVGTKCTVFFLLAFLLSVHVYGQSTVTGRVTGSEGDPLPRASIKIKGGSAGVNSNDDGYYTIKVNDLSQTLEISFVGFQTLT